MVDVGDDWFNIADGIIGNIFHWTFSSSLYANYRGKKPNEENIFPSTRCVQVGMRWDSNWDVVAHTIFIRRANVMKNCNFGRFTTSCYPPIESIIVCVRWCNRVRAQQHQCDRDERIVQQNSEWRLSCAIGNHGICSMNKCKMHHETHIRRCGTMNRRIH